MGSSLGGFQDRPKPRWTFLKAKVAMQSSDSRDYGQGALGLAL